MGSSTKNTKFFFCEECGNKHAHTHMCVPCWRKNEVAKEKSKKKLTEPTPEKTVFRSVISKIASFFLPTRQSSCDSLARSTTTSQDSRTRRKHRKLFKNLSRHHQPRSHNCVCSSENSFEFNKSLTSPFSESCDVCDCECVVIKLKSFFFPKKIT